MSASRSIALDFAPTPRFAIIRHIGSGGMGSVYEAYDRELEARVALKRLDRWEPHQLLRFKREFRDFQNLCHPNLVSIRELFSNGAEWYFSMELLDGVDFLEYVRPSIAVGTVPAAHASVTITCLDRTTSERPLPRARFSTRLVRGPLDEQRLRRALPQLALGIQALHDAGKLHCDIKPSNVLVTREERVVLVDYGVAVDLHDSRHARRVIGTVAYMAPEQAACRRTGRAADWYALGVMLYEALTGRLPHEGTAQEILEAKQRLDVPLPRDLEPTAPRDLWQLCADLLARDPSARPSGAEVLARLGVRSASSRPRAQATRFIGRTTQLSILHDAYRQAREHTKLVLVYGESGVGKSALVRHFIDEIERSDPHAVVLTGTCYERESVPYKAFDGVIDALAQYLERLPDEDARRLIPEHVALVAHAFPVLWGARAIQTAERDQTPRSIDPREQRDRLFGALRELLRRIAEAAPLVITIDDLQWTDADSLALLSELVAEPDAPRLLFVATVRTDDAKRESLERTQVARAIEGAHLLPVERLPPHEARALAEELVRDTASSRELDPDVIARVTDGHPLFLDALVRHASMATGTTNRISLADAVWSRVAPLAPDARRVLEIVALASGPIAREVVSAATGVSLADLASYVAALRAGHLLATHGSGPRDVVAPYHEQIRRAVLAHVDAAAQRAHHRRLAEAFEATNHTDPEALTIHWREAGEPARAAMFARLAAEKATSALAFERAAELYAQCLALLGAAAPRDLVVRHAEALANAGKGGEAGTQYLRAAEDASADEALELRRRAAEQLLISGRVDTGLSTLRDVLLCAGMNLAKTPRRALVRLLWSRAQLRLRGLRYEEQPASAIPFEELTRIDICWSSGIALGLIDSLRGADFQARNLLLSLRAGEPYRVARALAMESGYSAIGGSRTAARTAYLQRKAAAIAERVGHPHAIGLVRLMSGIGAFLNGRWQDACDRCHEAEEILRGHCTGVTWELDNAKLYPLWARIFLGRLDALGRRASLLLAEARARGDLYLETNLRTRVLNMVHLAADQPELARREVEAGIAGWSQQGFHLQNYFALHSRVEIALYEGRGVLAHQLMEKGWRLVRSSDFLAVQLMRIETLALRARCALMAAAQDRARAPALRSAARAFASRLLSENSLWATSFANLIQAAIDGNGEATRPMLEQAHDGFEKAGMALHAAAVKARLGDVARAAQSMRTLGVCNYKRMTELLAPGFDSRSPGSTR